MTSNRSPMLRASAMVLMLGAGLLCGCKTSRQTPQFTALPAPNSSPAELVHVNDTLKITYSDLPVGFQVPQPAVEHVGEDGRIRLLENKTFLAAGKTLRQLEEEIIHFYVPDYYKKISVSVTFQDNTQFFYVDGEVRSPNRQIYLGPITVLKAIASANGFTDFAHRTKVILTRADGRMTYVNCLKAVRQSELDPEVYPGDRIFVERKNPFIR